MSDTESEYLIPRRKKTKQSKKTIGTVGTVGTVGTAVSGNMEDTAPMPEEGKNFKARSWVFTLNNYPEDIFGTLEQEFMTCKYIFAKEVGEKTGTPHIQGYLYYKNAVYRNRILKKIPGVWLEKANGSLEQNYKYCAKQGNFVTNIEFTLKHEEEYKAYMEKKYENVIWKDWQQSILDIVTSEPNERTVHWFCEPNGNIGKSFLSKYLDWKYDAIIANGKQSDVFNQYKTFLEKKKTQPKLAIIDIPRSHQDYVCYSTLEKIKDGLIYSGKYEGGKLRLIPHHLIVFANFLPDYNKLSEDRWNVIQIEPV